ncbi:hypothetical protein M9H77_21527 [Catharanthus roseus]|uniref:Uncharacterized protein n=1 Tax=Catharanthus roseus TaxID=4058 RepID=A0ACC0APW3_CATRO|nr:hypothetical protein M9H77_21527 [Catharanthus roseus]
MQQKYYTNIKRYQGWQALARKRPTTNGRPRPTVAGGISRFLQDLFSRIQELKTLIQKFDLRLGDSRDDLRRHSGFNCGSRLNPKLSFSFSYYLQGCLELKKEEQSRATNWRLIGAID